MGITRQTIKRLEREAEALNQDKNRLHIIIVDEGGFYYYERNYKTFEELKEKEGIKDSDNTITIDKCIAEKNDINY